MVATASLAIGSSSAIKILNMLFSPVSYHSSRFSVTKCNLGPDARCAFDPYDIIIPVIEPKAFHYVAHPDSRCMAFFPRLSQKLTARLRIHAHAIVGDLNTHPSIRFKNTN